MANVFERLLALHAPVGYGEPDYCGRCGGTWPCDTARLLTVVEAARAWRDATTTYRVTMDAMTEGATVLDQRLRDALFSMRRAEDDLAAALAALEEDGD